MRKLNWTKNANIYEVNVRQFTKEGTLAAFLKHLPRLKEMGVDILWLMPVFPIGEKNRKGSLGSYYAVKDYVDVNPEFGTKDDLRDVIEKAHHLGIKIILDWVANHSAWDNVWTESHPEYFKKNEKGEFLSPFDWSDVIALDYANPGLRTAMINALKYWVEEFDVDGYRCDVAGLVPTDFWENARRELDKIKPVFMLAEDDEKPNLLQKAFDMNYSWKIHHLMNDIAQGKKKAADIWNYYEEDRKIYSSDKYRMIFTCNHDENSWNGTVQERMGNRPGEAFAVFTFVATGFPLIYNGQEAGLNKRLSFFDKDSIDWSNLKNATLYSGLTDLKHENHALWNGADGGKMIPLSKGINNNVLAFYREKDGDTVLVLMNLSSRMQNFKLENHKLTGDYTNFQTGHSFRFPGDYLWHLAPWEYLVFTKP